MYRRQRRAREIPFSFDSFLDVVANVVGIIIRLILVVWVAARTYPRDAACISPVSTNAGSAERVPASNPLESELARCNAELNASQQRLLQQLQRLGDLQGRANNSESELVNIARQRKHLLRLEAIQDLEGTEAAEAAVHEPASLTDLRRRHDRLMEQIRYFEAHPLPHQELRYRTPVSRPVGGEEIFFECREGRVAFIDIPALLAEIRREADDKSRLLRTRWRVTEESPAVGGYRLRYTLEREGGPAQAVAPAAAPDSDGGYRYGLSEWVVEPTGLACGEALPEALEAGSRFWRVIDRLATAQTVVTLWVYPDSFGVYRALRDRLYDRDLIVAGRPLPSGVSIISSRRGSLFARSVNSRCFLRPPKPN